MLLDANLALVLLIFVFTWLFTLSFFLFRVISRYRLLGSGAEKGSWQTVLEKILKQQEVETKRVNEVLERIGKLEKNSNIHLQKIGLVRFNPFSDAGGDHSFTLAMLDANDTGFIISSLHSRDNTRIYAKPVQKGKPLGYNFSKEEQESIEKAQKYGK